MLFQLTRSRGAWPMEEQDYNMALSISTHTLTWSVTEYLHILQILTLFQLTRSRGAWPDSERQYIVNMLHFNSHAHVERDSKFYNDVVR